MDFSRKYIFLYPFITGCIVFLNQVRKVDAMFKQSPLPTESKCTHALACTSRVHNTIHSNIKHLTSNRKQLVPVAFPRTTKQRACTKEPAAINRLQVHSQGTPGHDDPGTSRHPSQGRYGGGWPGTPAAGTQASREVTKDWQGEGGCVCPAGPESRRPAPGPHGTPPPPPLMSCFFITLHAHPQRWPTPHTEHNTSRSLTHQLMSQCRVKLRLKYIIPSFQRWWQHTLERLPGCWSHSPCSTSRLCNTRHCGSVAHTAFICVCVQRPGTL